MTRDKGKHYFLVRGIQLLLLSQIILFPGHYLTGKNSGPIHGTSISKGKQSTTEHMSPEGKCEEGVFRRLIPNGTAFAGVDCRPVPQTICYEAIPQEGNKTLYIFDPCGENFGVLVDNNPDRSVTQESYYDPVTGEYCIIYWFDPPLEPVQ